MIDWAVAERPLPGQSCSGDSSVVAPFADGVLVGVVDGLGHGEEASAASYRAVRTLEHHRDDPVEALMRRCHDALRGTRGAVMSLASLRPARCTMTWLAVGNVEAIVVSPEEGAPRVNHVISRGGIVGYSLPPLMPSAAALFPEDLLVLATDGIRPSFTETFPTEGSPRTIADGIVRSYAQESDDALVLVARIAGEAA